MIYVFKGDTQTKTLKRVFADHIQSAFSSIHVFFKKKQKVIMSRFPTGILWFVVNCIDIILDIITDYDASLASGGRKASAT